MPLAPVPALAPVSAKLVVPVMSPPPAVVAEVKPEYVMLLPPEDTLVASSKFATTLLIVPLPVTLVAAAKVMPRVTQDVSSKFDAPVTVVAALAAPKPE